MPVRKGQKSTPTVAELEERVPHSREAEASVLGGILAGLNPVSVLAGARQLLSADDFFIPNHRLIWEAMVAVSNVSREIDLVMLKERLAGAGQLETVGGPAFIASLVDGVPKSSNVQHYARIVKDKAVRRGIMEGALCLAGACTNGHETSALLEAGSDLYRQTIAVDPEARKGCASTHELMSDYSANVTRGRGQKVWTRIRPLDEATDGMRPGEVLTIVKRPQVGGSAIASQILHNAAIEGEPCVFFSLEMPRTQAFERLVQQRLGLSRALVERLGAAGWSALTASQRAALNGMAVNIIVVDRGKSGISELDSSMLQASAKLERPPRLVAIDYLGLLSSGAKNLPLYQRVSEAAVDVKSFAKRHECAVVLISQAGRDQDQEKSEGAKELGLDAARDSGQVEEAADFMLTLWRPELSSTTGPLEKHRSRGQLWGRLVKNRRGPLPSFCMHLDVETLRISDGTEGS
ncbi:MAG TPA: DnaB-like helicase C-terminal domain-containing protein [Candidatus Dormibacteraeota bacterium]|nr:DnaB-like helicase C-terminal domain-containing protein [Candidatus Dormibacteraeota bacterium]